MSDTIEQTDVPVKAKGCCCHPTNDTNELAAALAKAQSTFTNPERNRTVQVTMRTGGSYTFSYATLDTILDMVRKPLSDNGLALSHSVSERDGGGWMCITRLLHSSGQSIECPIPILVAPDANAQGFGSGITYAKRYGVCTILAITAEEDDDGNAACGNAAQQLPRKAQPGKNAFGGKPKAPPKATGEGKWSEGTPDERAKYVLDKIAVAQNAAQPDKPDVKLPAAERIKKISEMVTWVSQHGKDVSPADAQKIVDAAFQAETEINAEKA